MYVPKPNLFSGPVRSIFTVTDHLLLCPSYKTKNQVWQVY